jgi:hypothetical protein
MTIYFRGTPVEIRITGTTEGVDENGSKVLFLDIEAVIPPGPGGPGEPIELPRAA